jgi:hypothetical protein
MFVRSFERTLVCKAKNQMVKTFVFKKQNPSKNCFWRNPQFIDCRFNGYARGKKSELMAFDSLPVDNDLCCCQKRFEGPGCQP